MVATQVTGRVPEFGEKRPSYELRCQTSDFTSQYWVLKVTLSWLAGGLVDWGPADLGKLLNGGTTCIKDHKSQRSLPLDWEAGMTGGTSWLGGIIVSAKLRRHFEH